LLKRLALLTPLLLIGCSGTDTLINETSQETQSIEELLAREEIKQLKASYFRCLDTKNWTCIEALFTQDAEAIYSAGEDPDRLGSPANPIMGPQAIAAFIRQGVEHLVTVHHGHMPEISFTSPTTAQGIWAMEDILQDPVTGINVVHGFGHYHETYQRIDGKWYIKTLQLTRLRADRTESD